MQRQRKDTGRPMDTYRSAIGDVQAYTKGEARAILKKKCGPLPKGFILVKTGNELKIAG